MINQTGCVAHNGRRNHAVPKKWSEAKCLGIERPQLLLCTASTQPCQQKGASWLRLFAAVGAFFYKLRIERLSIPAELLMEAPTGLIFEQDSYFETLEKVGFDPVGHSLLARSSIVLDQNTLLFMKFDCEWNFDPLVGFDPRRKVRTNRPRLRKRRCEFHSSR